MLLTAESAFAQNYKIFDCRDQQIPYAIRYNTETREITTYLHIKGVGFVSYLNETVGILPKTVTFVLEGSYAVDPQGNKI